MAIVDITDETFDSVVTGNDIVIVDFWAPWCGPCRQFAPVFEQVSEKHPDVVFAKVNTDEETGIAQHFQIRSIPTLMAFREKVLLYANPGAMPAGPFEQLVAQIKAVDMAQVHAEIAARDTPGESDATPQS